MARTLVLIVSFTLLVTLATGQDAGKGDRNPLFPAIFFFGDSTLDTGNNNFISTTLKSNFLPYGRDLPGHQASGRFSNGRLVSDLLSAEFGIKDFSPPYLDPSLSGEDLRTGVNFASAGSGYDEATSLTTNTMPTSRQLELFKTYITKLKGVVGEGEASRIVGNALFVISSGNNDVGLNFYLNPWRREEYKDFLHGKLQGFVKNLYDLGARWFGVFGLLPIGCVPNNIDASSPVGRACVEEMNQYCASYNWKLQGLFPEMLRSLPGSKIMYLDWFDPLLDMAKHPEKYGFREPNIACCGSAGSMFFAQESLCSPLGQTCPDASLYVFFDSIHPTESAYRTITRQIMDQAIPKLKSDMSQSLVISPDPASLSQQRKRYASQRSTKV